MGLQEEFAEMKHRITVEAYHRMGEAGVLAPDARTELIEGEILDKAPIGSRHASVVNRLTSLFVPADGRSCRFKGRCAWAIFPSPSRTSLC